jgi:hypothetical protein
MGHAIADACDNRKIVIHSHDVSAPCRIGKRAAWSSFAHGAVKPGPARGRAARLRLTTTFLAAAFLALICTLEAKAGDRASQAGEMSVPPAQAMTGDPEELQKALDNEHHRAELLARELTTVRHLQMLLTLQKARVESAKLRQLPENEYAESVKYLQQERERLKQAAESGWAELCKSMRGDPAERLVQDLATARRNVEIQTALAARASEEAAKLKQAAKSDTAELRQSLQQEQERAGRLDQDLAAARRGVETQTALAAKAADDVRQAKRAADGSAAEARQSLQQEQERAGRLERDLAAARRDVETQTALVTKASDEASQLKQVAEQGSAELKLSLQKEHERAEALAKELSMAHTAIYAYEAQARKASDQTADSRQADENGAAMLRKSLRQEQERASRLEQDLAAARRDVETQMALASKANEDAARSKQTAEKGSAELQRSLQKEHDRAESLAQNLSMVHTAIYTYEVLAHIATDQAAVRKQAEQSGAAELRKSLVQASERAARLEQQLAAARRDVETQTALVADAGAEAARLKRAAADSFGESQRLLQQERDKTARLERELAAERKTKEALAASGAMTAARVTQDKRPGADTIKPVAATQTSATAAQSDAKPDPKPDPKPDLKRDPEHVAEVAKLVARASVLLGQGDIGSARIVLERAAETGNAQASFALAETYDPLVLRRWGAYGTLGDAAKARDLYARAQAGGVKEAKERFDALRR